MTADGVVMIVVVVSGRIEIGDGIATTTGIAVAAMIVMTDMIAMVGTGTMAAITTDLSVSPERCSEAKTAGATSVSKPT